jgi:hypothetical protein
LPLGELGDKPQAPHFLAKWGILEEEHVRAFQLHISCRVIYTGIGFIGILRGGSLAMATSTVSLLYIPHYSKTEWRAN